MLLKLMYPWNDLEWKRPIESESEPEIETKHLDHKDLTN